MHGGAPNYHKVRHETFTNSHLTSIRFASEAMRLRVCIGRRALAQTCHTGWLIFLPFFINPIFRCHKIIKIRHMHEHRLSQQPVEYWHAWIGEATIADAILDAQLSKMDRKGEKYRLIVTVAITI